jgi:hypothetical protein
MAQFDVRTFFELTGKGGGPVQALGTAFGMPSCLINLGAEALAILPTPILNSLRGSTANGVNRADDVIKAFSAKLRNLTGIIEYDTEDGTFRFVSDSSSNGIDRNEGGLLGALGGFVGALGAAAGFAGRLYNNYNTTVAQINAIKDCIQSYNDYAGYAGSFAADERVRLATESPAKYQEILNYQFGSEQQDLQNALQFKLDALLLLQNIDRTIGQRLANPNLEPVFTDDYSQFTSGTSLKTASPSATGPVEEIFRLTFGPPISKQGKFILSKDGLYYDSQTSGIIPALLEVETNKSKLPIELNWKLEFDSNLGGRGKPTTLDGIKSYVNTILDPNILDDSQFLQNYYSQDLLFQDLVGQKNRRIFDVSSQIRDLEIESASQLLIANLRQVMLSETSHYLSKINKRKKQIELAVKMPVIYGKGALYEPGKIPINDFSYLDGINFELDIQKQKTLILNQADVSGVILPLVVKYTQQIDHSDQTQLDHLLISNIALGGIVSNPSGTLTNNLSINNPVIEDSLICLYNYLSVDIDSPSSTSFNLFNSSKVGNKLNGQLVGKSPSSIFDTGLGVVYLHGITKHSNDNPTVPSSVGSYIKLPSQPEFQDLLYNKNGFTFETWVHVPQLDGEYYGFNDNYDISGLYRLILANENTGLQGNQQGNILQLNRDNGTDSVKGLIFGFTRDRRITLNQTPSNDTHDNKIENACLFLAPTQSFNSSSIGFISRSQEIGDTCYNATGGWHNMKYPIWNTTNGVSLSSCGKEFCQIAVTLLPNANEIKMYCDGKLLTTSSYTSVFGINPLQELPKIPSLKKNNSFEYNTSSMSSVNVTDLKYGPKLDTYFTPWVLGGGYTDGMQQGNFMGGQYGGIISGLKGYLGSTKFYSKALNEKEILQNFNATRNFFKNIDVPNLMWEPIESLP